VTIARYIGGHSIPAPEFFDGIAAVQLHNYLGHPAWCLSKYSENSFWYFFPVALAVKTPLAMMGLVILGIGISCQQLLRQRARSGATRFA
jgi:Sec-independent protein secretion pathway component TatC